MGLGNFIFIFFIYFFPPGLRSLQCAQRVCARHFASGGVASTPSPATGLHQAAVCIMGWLVPGTLLPMGFCIHHGPGVGLAPSILGAWGWHPLRCTHPPHCWRHGACDLFASILPPRRFCIHHDAWDGLSTTPASPTGAERPRRGDRRLRGATMPTRRGTHWGKRRKKQHLHPRRQKPTVARPPCGLHPSLTSSSIPHLLFHPCRRVARAARAPPVLSPRGTRRAPRTPAATPPAASSWHQGRQQPTPSAEAACTGEPSAGFAP